MIFNPLYFKVFKPWVIKVKRYKLGKTSVVPTRWERVLAWIAYPLGYCIYCSTTWITFFICALYLSVWEILPCWQDIVIGVIAASGMQHIVVSAACRWIINGHPDLE